MFTISVDSSPDDVLRSCAASGLEVAWEGHLGSHRAPGAIHWHLRWPDRSGTLEVTAAGDGAVLGVAANRDAGWARGFARRMQRRLADEAALATGTLPALRPRVLVVVHDPPMDGAGSRRLSEVMGWHAPEDLVARYVADVALASHGRVRYSVVDRRDAAWWPPKADGFRYTGSDYLQRWRRHDMYKPDAIDRHAQVRAFDLVGLWDRDEIDECWILSFPYAGDFESSMVGRSAFWCNSPPIDGFGSCSGRFVVMGFNYERDVGCMLENLAHRAESMLRRVWQGRPLGKNLWEVFGRLDRGHPGGAHCGTVHFAPNSERDYDWGNRRAVPSFCDAWAAGVPPDERLRRGPRLVDCREWGDGDMRAHHLWWLQHFPHAIGESHGIANDWWRYVADPNLVT